MPLPADDCTFKIAVLTTLLASVGQSSGSSAVPPIQQLNTNRRAVAINHVATICSRGEERNRIVAAVAGPLFANSVKITLLRDR